MKKTKTFILMFLIFTIAIISLPAKTVGAKAVSTLAHQGFEGAVYEGSDRDYVLTLLPLDGDFSGVAENENDAVMQTSENKDTYLMLESGLSWSDLRRAWWLDCLHESNAINPHNGLFTLRLSWGRQGNEIVRTGFELGASVHLDGEMEKGFAFEFPVQLKLSLTPGTDNLKFPFTFGAGFMTGFDAHERNAYFGPVAHVSAGLEAHSDGGFIISLTTRLDATVRFLTEESHNSTIEITWTPVTFAVGTVF